MARYIDAEALIEQMEADAEHIDNYNVKMALYSSIDDVKNAPTADVVEHIRGKWKQKANYLWQGYECSQCKYEIASRTNFCPMCGAEMQKGVKIC